MISSQVHFIFHIPYHIFIFHIILFPRLLWYTNLFHSMINSQLSIYSGLTSTWQRMFLFLMLMRVIVVLFIFHIIFSHFKLSFQISYYLFIFYIILLMVMWGHDGAGQKDGWGGHFLEWDKIFSAQQPHDVSATTWRDWVRICSNGIIMYFAIF